MEVPTLTEHTALRELGQAEEVLDPSSGRSPKTSTELTAELKDDQDGCWVQYNGPNRDD